MMQAFCRDFYFRIIEDSDLLEYDSLFLGDWLQRYRRFIVPSSCFPET